jgi:hypothetical protein
MGKRLAAFAAVLGLILVLAGFNWRFDRLVWLLLALAASGVAIWATAAYRHRAEPQPEPANRADRLALEPPAGETAAADASRTDRAQISGKR